MLIKFICCDVFTRIVCDIISKSPHVVDVEFMPMLAHTEPTKLRKELQERITLSAGRKKYDRIVLGYGLCGNATAGLYCDVPMIIPRVHDCCAMFLGSKEQYMREFGDCLSARWCSNGYYERCFISDDSSYYNMDDSYKTNIEYLQLVEEYGEDNAEYVWTTMHPAIETKEAIYIRMEGFEYNDSLPTYKKYVDGMGCELKVLDGDIRLLDELINGPWDNGNFLQVMPGEKIVPVYDMDVVLKAEPC